MVLTLPAWVFPLLHAGAVVSGFHFAAFDKAGEKCTQGLECTVMVLSLCRNLCVAPAGSGCLGGAELSAGGWDNNLRLVST